MLSPDVYTLHPFLLLFDDCGIGSDPNQTGPCVGGYGPEHLSESFLSTVASGKGQVLSVGAVLLVLLAVLVLLRLLRRATSGKASKKKAASDDESQSVPCSVCGQSTFQQVGEPLCTDCLFVERVESLEPGEGWCAGCDHVYVSDGSGCPCCGAGGADDDDDFAVSDVTGLQPCSVCGVLTPADELQGDMFPACAACADEAEAEERLREIDSDGPDGDNPNGIGAQDEGVRA